MAGREVHVRRGWTAAVMAGVLVFAPGQVWFSGPARALPRTSDLAARMLAPTTDDAASADAFSLLSKRNQLKKLPRPLSLLVLLGPLVGFGVALRRSGRIRFGDGLLIMNLRLDRAAPRAPPLLSIS